MYWFRGLSLKFSPGIFRTILIEERPDTSLHGFDLPFQFPLALLLRVKIAPFPSDLSE